MKTTALHGVHLALGAKMTPFGGWDMPLAYGSIRDEHAAVRARAGLFDLGHMGRFSFTGPDRVRLLERVATNRYEDLPEGRARYALICQPDGGVIDDIIAYVLEDECFVVVNASNRDTDLAWIRQQRADSGLDAEVADRSDELAMLAVQGPASVAILSGLTGADLDAVPYYGITAAELGGVPTLCARTGYTGEDGFELYFAASEAEAMWARLLEHGAAHGLQPCGLGARDTLRLEAAMPLYGHEITREVNPYEAGLGFAVKLDKAEPYPGQQALAHVKESGAARRLVCIVCTGRRIPRDGQPVRMDGEPVGTVTSGTFSPTLERPVCMALIDRGRYAMGAAVTIDVRGKELPGEIVKRPFYKREAP
jgi:aminomethyltransferase